MKIASIIWRILVNLVVVAVILGMFHIARSPFETVVISALVLIYAAVTNSFALLANSLLQIRNQDLERFIKLAKSLQVETKIYEQAHTENLDEVEKAQVTHWIDVVFKWLIALISIMYLVYSVV